MEVHMSHATPRHTVRYAARAAYQLALMTARYTSTQVGYYCVVWTNLGIVEVHGVVGRDGEYHVEAFPIAKSWANL